MGCVCDVHSGARCHVLLSCEQLFAFYFQGCDQMTVFFGFKVNMRRLKHVYGLGTKHTLLCAGSLGWVASRCLRLTFGCATKCLSLFVMT